MKWKTETGVEKQECSGLYFCKIIEKKGGAHFEIEFARMTAD